MSACRAAGFVPACIEQSGRFRCGVRRFHHREFSDVARLIEARGSQRISVCIPTFQEAETIGGIVEIIRRDLMDAQPLVDEIWVIDSGSTDGTLDKARAAGAHATLASDIRPDLGSYPGKGENLWKALHVARGEVVVYIDGDIRNFGAHFVTGLVGPLLLQQDIDFVKAYYHRPLIDPDGIRTADGGRVTEILVRPMISLFFPELAGVLQPLAGEYAARRSLLETLSFPVGYGVEMAHLIDLCRKGLLGHTAQTDLEEREHRNQDNQALGKTAFAILHVMLRRLAEDGKIAFPGPLSERLHQCHLLTDSVILHEQQIREIERPPLNTLDGFPASPHLPSGW
jgi:glucosyl-3-phosphoglycerate synthase